MVEQGCVLSMGVFISASTKIVDRATGEIFRGQGAGLFGRGAGHPTGKELCRTARQVPDCHAW